MSTNPLLDASLKQCIKTKSNDTVDMSGQKSSRPVYPWNNYPSRIYLLIHIEQEVCGYLCNEFAPVSL
jgi:hypothetical protein